MGTRPFLLLLFLSSAQLLKAQTTIYTQVDQNPEFPGGQNALTKYLEKHLQYPMAERVSSIDGIVLVRFVVNEDGGVSNAEVTKGITTGLNKEAVRLVMSLPKFKPGIKQGKAVKTYVNVPVIFVKS